MLVILKTYATFYIMLRLIALISLTVVSSLPTLVIDRACIPNIACGIVSFAMANKGIGLAGINDVEITSTNPMHRASARYTCPPNYCTRLVEPSPKNANSCFEYPFASTKEGHRNNKCVPVEELRKYEETLKDFYSSNNIGNGDGFYVKVVNIQPESCLLLYS